MEIYKNLSLENLENEIWLPVVGFEGLYEVSSLGRVKSLRNRYGTYREKILKQGKYKDGYLKVLLYKDEKKKTCRVNRLVAIAFIDNPNNFRCVNHKDENKTNNCVDNLEWCTHQYNLNYGTAQARRVASTDWKSVAEKKSKRVYQYTKNGELVGIWESTRECGRQGFNQGNVSACCNNCFKREGNNVYKNYIWSYREL